MVPYLIAALGLAAPSYFHDIRPILQKQCQGCHQPNLKQSNLDLTTFESLASGGKRGNPLQPGGLLLQYVSGALKPQMPLGQPALPKEQVELIRTWLEASPKDDTPSELREQGGANQPIVYHQAPVITALAFSPDGKFLAVSGNREIFLHPLDSSAGPRRLAGLSDRILSLAFSADGSLLYAGGGTPARFGEIQVWATATGKLRRSIMVSGDTVFGLSLSPDGRKVAIGCTDNTVRLFDAASGKELYKIGNHENWVLGTVFGGDSKRLVSVSRDRAAKLTNADSGAFLENINLLRDELAAVARHPSKELVVIAGEDRIPFVYRMDRPKNMKIADDTTLVHKLDRQAGAVAALAWSGDGRWIAVAGASPEVNVYDAETGKHSFSAKGHTAGIYSVAFSPDSATLAAAGFDGRVRLYSVPAGELKKAFIPVPLETAGDRTASVRTGGAQ